MEKGAIFAAGKVDPVGYTDCGPRNGGASHYCVCITSERKGGSSVPTS